MPTRNHRAARRSGFSLIEMLISSFLLLLVVIGLVPLFAQSIRSNESAEETSDLLRAAQLQMEGLVQLPFNDDRITVDSGAEEVTSHQIHPTTAYKLYDEDLVAPAYVRNRPVDSELTIRHFNIAAIDDGVLDQADALDASMPANLVHFKQIVMDVKRTDFAVGLPIGKSEIQMIKAN